MEESVWLYFSVIAVLLAFGIIGGLLAKQKDHTKIESFRSALDSLATQCNYVCSLGKGTSLPVEVLIPSGVYLYTNGPKICGTLGDYNRCTICDCMLEPYELALNTTFAEKVLKDQTYSCLVTRTYEGATLECQG